MQTTARKNETTVSASAATVASRAPIAGDTNIWLLAFRTCFLSLALAATTARTYAYHDGVFTHLDVENFYAPIAVFFALTAAGAVWHMSQRRPRLLSAAQLAVDVLLVSGAVYVTGGPVSPISFLYVLLVMETALLFSRRTAFLVAGAGTVCFLLCNELTRAGIFSTPEGVTLAGITFSGIVLQAVGLASAMLLVAIATCFLANRLSVSDALVAESKREVADLHRKQTLLLDGIKDALFLTDVEGRVHFLNDPAKAVLNLPGTDYEAHSLEELLQLRGAEPRRPLPLGEWEIDLPQGDGEPKLRFAFNTRVVTDGNGIETGRQYLCQDVTKLRSMEDQLEMQERVARLLAEKGMIPGPARSKVTEFVGESPVMQRIFRLIDRAAASDATVLINGESGTGKELVAKALHRGGTRADAPFVPVNCGAIPENLIESELFGHKKGSFTGADSDNVGLFRKAHGGTIFLDEIGELPLPMQVKLLRALQERSVRPVGVNVDIPIDVRVIAATNKNLRYEVSGNRFREDLFYRLNVINIHLPPLRDRKDDIPLLASAALKRLSKTGSPPLIPPASMQLLMSYSYPGNVRELENVLERALVLGGEVILPQHLPDPMRESSSEEREVKRETTIIVDENLQFPVNLDQILSNVEQRYIEAALQKTHGAKKKAAELLGINFRSFRYRLQKLPSQDSEQNLDQD